MLQRARMSTKGQIVIPATIRRRLGLAVGQEMEIDVDESQGMILLRTSYTVAEADRLLKRSIAWERTNSEDPVEKLHEARRKARRQERASRRA